MPPSPWTTILIQVCMHVYNVVHILWHILHSENVHYAPNYQHCIQISLSNHTSQTLPEQIKPDPVSPKGSLVPALFIYTYIVSLKAWTLKCWIYVCIKQKMVQSFNKLSNNFFLNMIGTVDNECGEKFFQRKKINTKRVEDRATTAWKFLQIDYWLVDKESSDFWNNTRYKPAWRELLRHYQFCIFYIYLYL